jgi:hypothetical protein
MLGETKKKRKPVSEGRYDGGDQACILKVMKITPKQNVTGLIMPLGLAIARKSVVEGLSLWTRFYMLSLPFFFLLVLIFCCVLAFISYIRTSTTPPLRSLRSCIYNCRTVYHITLLVLSVSDNLRTFSAATEYITESLSFLAWSYTNHHTPQLCSKASTPPLTLKEPTRPDTPAAALSSPLLQNRSLKDMRKALQDDLMHRTEISLDEFIGTFVPKLPEGVKVTSNFATQMYKAQAWRRFLPYLSNARGIETEDVVSERLTRIFNKMVQQAQKQWKTRCPLAKQQWSLLTAHSATPTTVHPKDCQPSNQTHTFTAKLVRERRRTHTTTWLSLQSSRSTVRTPT